MENSTHIINIPCVLPHPSPSSGAAALSYNFFYFLLLFFDVESHQGRALWTQPWGVNYRNTSLHPLVRIEPRMSGSTAHPKLPTTRRHPNGFLYNALFTKEKKRYMQQYTSCTDYK